MTQVPRPALPLTDAQVPPACAPDPERPPAVRTALAVDRESDVESAVTPQARQFVIDRALSALRTVWASRRDWQDESDEAHARIAELEVVQHVLIGQLQDSRARVTALKAAVASLRKTKGEADA